MQQIQHYENLIISKIRTLPPERLGAVEDFIDFLAYRSRGQDLHRAINQINSAAFNKIWDNDEDADADADADAEYDKL